MKFKYSILGKFTEKIYTVEHLYQNNICLRIISIPAKLCRNVYK